MMVQQMPGHLYIGTSGWSYPHWQGTVYPHDLPEHKRLSFYATHLPSVEINNSFYHLPSDRALNSWREAVPVEFIFTLKASAYITHRKKLRDPERTLPPLMHCAEILGQQLGAILFQLPPHWHLDLDRLQRFLAALPERWRYAFEFRDPSWFAPPVYELLKSHHAALCVYELAGFRSPQIYTADFAYYRWHGPGAAYQGNYGEEFLNERARVIRAHLRAGEDVFVYFDNDEAGYAFHNARYLWEQVRQGEDCSRSMS